MIITLGTYLVKRIQRERNIEFESHGWGIVLVNDIILLTCTHSRISERNQSTHSTRDAASLLLAFLSHYVPLYNYVLQYRGAIIRVSQ